ncbi:MAG TPA: BTAD domain-containing putative transcriptional regulator, partial [Chloroflexota bacterium]
MGRSGYGPGGVVGANQPPDIRLTLLGGFRVEHRHVVPESAWQQRRSAKALVKVLAAQIEHALHREQVLEYLWPEVDFVSAVNSFGKALHVARRALEPDMASRGPSSYLRLSNDVISLVTDRIWIDTDHFRSAADEALRHGDVVSLESALALYTGELLPEDTYESWAIARRDELAELHLRLLFGLACALEQRGDRDEAIERHNNVLQIDPAREDVHRHLMRLYAESGRRLQALRQYQLCCEVLRQELDVPPERATVELYEEIRNGRLQTVVQVEKPAIRVPDEREHISIPRFSPTPLFGRDQVLRLLLEDFAGAESGSGFTVMVSGEVGVGKTRLVAEAAREAAREDALVLWGASSEPRSWLPYGPFGEALETYIATCDAGERQALAARYPELTRLA